jgi:hypothetical protein
VQELAKTTISLQQKKSLKDFSVKGTTRAAKFTLPSPPEDGIQQLLLQIIGKHNEDNVEYTRPQSSRTSMEWTAYRKTAGRDALGAETSELEKYRGLIGDTLGVGLVVFLYGGGS